MIVFLPTDIFHLEDIHRFPMLLQFLLVVINQRVNIKHIKMKFNGGKDKLEPESLFQFSVDLNLNLIFYKKVNLSAKFIKSINAYF